MRVESEMKRRERALAPATRSPSIQLEMHRILKPSFFGVLWSVFGFLIPASSQLKKSMGRERTSIYKRDHGLWAHCQLCFSRHLYDAKHAAVARITVRRWGGAAAMMTNRQIRGSLGCRTDTSSRSRFSLCFSFSCTLEYIRLFLSICLDYLSVVGRSILI